MPEAAKIKGIADILFLVDSTGSMKPCIDALRARIKELVTSLQVGNPITWRSAVVGYRDVFVDSEWLIGATNPFVSDQAALEAQAAGLSAEGGGPGQAEIAESGLDALWTVMHRTDWVPAGGAHRVVVVLTDAPAKPLMHESTAGPGQPADVMAVAQYAANEHFKLLIFGPDDQVWKTLGAVPRSQFFDVSAGSTADVYEGLKNLDWTSLITRISSTVSQVVQAAAPVQAAAAAPAASPASVPAPLPAPAPGSLAPGGTIKAP